jgi:hypothetical protein
MWPPDFSEFQLWSNSMPLLFRGQKDNRTWLSSAADSANVELGIVQPEECAHVPSAPRRLVQNQDSAFEPRQHDEEAGSAPRVGHALPLPPPTSLGCDTQKPFQSCIRNRGLEQHESSLMPVRSTSSSAGTTHSTITDSTIAMTEPPKPYLLPTTDTATTPVQRHHTGVASFASSSTTLMNKQAIIATVPRAGLPPKKYRRALRTIRWTWLTSVVVPPIT